MMKFYDRPIILITDKSKLKFGSTFSEFIILLPSSQTDFLGMSVSSSLFKSCSVPRTLRCFVCFTFMEEEEEGYEGG